jgi:hypothetical protein
MPSSCCLISLLRNQIQAQWLDLQSLLSTTERNQTLITFNPVTIVNNPFFGGLASKNSIQTHSRYANESRSSVADDIQWDSMELEHQRKVFFPPIFNTFAVVNSMNFHQNMNYFCEFKCSLHLVFNSTETTRRWLAVKGRRNLHSIFAKLTLLTMAGAITIASVEHRHEHGVNFVSIHC